MKTKGNISNDLSDIVYTTVRTELTLAAQRNPLASINMEAVDRDYRHILDIHIKNGDKRSVTDVFQFFNHLFHSNDNQTQIQECTSFKRMKDRMQTVNDQIATKDHVNGMQSFRYEDTISLQQYYAQTRP
eukprot:345729_1